VPVVDQLGSLVTTASIREQTTRMEGTAKRRIDRIWHFRNSSSTTRSRGRPDDRGRAGCRIRCGARSLSSNRRRGRARPRPTGML